MQKSKYGISKNRVKLLPQINGFANFSDSIDPSVSVTDGSSYGISYNIARALQYGANAGVELRTPLYNQTLYISISITEIVDEMSRPSYEKAQEDLILRISEMYYLGQVIAEQIVSIRTNIIRSEELGDITQAFFDNGMVMEVDLKRANINLENLKVQYDNVQVMMMQQLNMLEYIMGYPAEKGVGLLPTNTNSIATVALTRLSESLYKLQLFQPQVQLAEQQKRLISNGYTSSLNLMGNWRFAAYTDETYHWFHSSPSNRWSRSYGVGLAPRTPTLDDLDKKHKVRKAMINIETTKLSRLSTRKDLQTQHLNVVNDLTSNQRNFKKQKGNYLLIEGVYTATADHYREGITSMTGVLQGEIRMSETQNNYISVHYSYRATNLMLLKLTRQISSLFK